MQNNQSFSNSQLSDTPLDQDNQNCQKGKNAQCINSSLQSKQSNYYKTGKNCNKLSKYHLSVDDLTLPSNHLANCVSSIELSHPYNLKIQSQSSQLNSKIIIHRQNLLNNEPRYKKNDQKYNNNDYKQKFNKQKIEQYQKMSNSIQIVRKPEYQQKQTAKIKQSNLIEYYQHQNQLEQSHPNQQKIIQDNFLKLKSSISKKINENKGQPLKNIEIENFKKNYKNYQNQNIINRQHKTLQMDGQFFQKYSNILNQQYKKSVNHSENSRTSSQSKHSIIDRQLFNKQKIVDFEIQKSKNKMYSSVKNSLINNEKQFQKYKIYFPYQPYTVQAKFMECLLTALENSTNALLESPTGTGKTLCLLTSVLGWVEENKKKKFKQNLNLNEPKIKIVYLSRTHNQLKQTQNQLIKTCYRPTMAVFGSRDQLCIKAELNQIKGRQKMQACSKAVKIALKIIKRQQRQTLKQQQLRVACQHYMPEKQVLEKAIYNFKNKIIDMDQIKQLGIQHSFCPYYYPHHISTEADIFFMPYNYLLDVDLLPKYKDIINKAILIFDEAHNVPDSACSGRNYMLTTSVLNGVENQMSHLQNYPKPTEQLFNIRLEKEAQIDSIRLYIGRLKKRMDVYFKQSHHFVESSLQQYRQGVQTKVIPQQKIKQELYKLLIQNQKRQYGQKQYQRELISKLSPLVHYCLSIIQSLKQTIDGKYNQTQKFAAFLFKTLSLITTIEIEHQWMDLEYNHYRLFLKMDPADYNTATAQLVCLTPSLTFKEIKNCQPRSIILASGTLSPLDSWSKQLLVDFPYTISNKHVINSNQLKLQIVKKGFDGAHFNFSYSNTTNNKQIYPDLAKSIISLLSKIPNGVLVIFPSHRIKNSFQYTIRTNNLSYKLTEVKHCYFENRTQNDNLIKIFKQKAMTQKGAVLFCVCRGKVSQGMDFADQLCRAVIFIGVPYPDIKDPWINQKKSYLSQLCRRYNTRKQIRSITGEQWYNLQTMRAVNQSLGRVIRHKNDFGLIFLFDQRYAQDKLINYLPQWSKESLSIKQNFLQVNQQTLIFLKNISNLNLERLPNIQQKQVKKQKPAKPIVNAFDKLRKGQQKLQKRNKKDIGIQF